jgi:DNA-binding CsgD family transcriptional regulator/tetratricopeptide (TPR) repeat protein
LELTTEAVSLVPDEPTNARAKVLGVHARMLARSGRYAEGREVAMTALALAERLDMPRLASDIRTTLVGLEKLGGPSESLVEALRSAIAGAVEAGASNTELRALLLLGNHHLDRAEFSQADEAFTQATSRAKAQGTPWVPYAAEARWMNAVSLRMQGRWDEALAVVDVSKEVVPPIYEALLAGTRCQILVARGDPRGLELAHTLRPFWRQEGMVATTAGASELEAAQLVGDQATAGEIYRLITDTLTSIWHPLFQARVRLAATTLAAYAQGAVHRSSIERASDASVVAALVADSHAVLERRNEKSGTSWGPESRAWESRVEAELLRWRWVAGIDPPSQAELVEAWRETEERFGVFGAPYELASVRATLAEVLTAVGDVAGGETAAKAAGEVAEQLGARPLLARLGRSADLPPQRGHAVALTPRESEILALVAEGRSNGEIGRQLFISTKTVSVHVSNILGKLGASGRTEAAAIARRDGLLG